jgi:membrane protein DedA with SNARE-associated domain
MTASIISDIAGWVDDLTGWLDDVSANWWFLGVIFVIAFFDSIIPIVPSETTVILGGVAAGQGDQLLLLVILSGAVGAFLGDNAAYLIGRRFKERVRRWADRDPQRVERLDGAARQIRKRGGLLLITARFIPGGRTLLTVSSGLTEQPHRWFAGWVAVATLIWASYAAVLGAVFGRAFKDNHTAAFLLAFVTALGITGIIEVVRWQRERRAAR